MSTKESFIEFKTLKISENKINNNFKLNYENKQSNREPELLKRQKQNLSPKKKKKSTLQEKKWLVRKVFLLRQNQKRSR